MSVVACRVDGDKIEIYADSITVRGWTQQRNNTNRSKLIKTNGMIIGSVGSAEESSLFQMFCNTRKPAGIADIQILEFLHEFSQWKDEKADDSDIDNDYILVFGGKAFAISGYLVEEIVTYEAIGAGFAYSLAALYLGSSASKAVETAIELSVFCEYPVQGYTIENGEIVEPKSEE